MKILIWIGASEEVIDTEEDLGISDATWNSMASASKLEKVKESFFDIFEYGFEKFEE